MNGFIESSVIQFNFRFYIDKKSDPENMFRVSTDGVVRTFNYLDREKKPEHRIHIMCIDEGR